MASPTVSSPRGTHRVHHQPQREPLPRLPYSLAWAVLAGVSACLGQLDLAGKTCGARGECPAGLSCSAENTCERGVTSGGPSAAGEQRDPGSRGAAPPAGERPRAEGAGGQGGGRDEVSAPLPLEPVGGSGSASAAADASVPAPSSGSPDAGFEAPSVVAGHVIDYFRRPVPGLPVSIGEVTVVTNEAGEFRFEGISRPYDVALLSEQVGDYTHAWVYQGLTRPDPTLQVFFGLPERGSATFTLSTNIERASTQKLSFAGAGPQGAWSYFDAYGDFSTSGIGWRGPSQAAFTFHALLSEASESGLPSSYLAHDQQPVLLEENASAEVLFDLSRDDIAASSVAGSVSGGGDERYNYAYLQFPDQAQIELFYAAAAEAAFDYVVPALPETSIVVAATAGRYASEYAIAHRQVAAGDRNIQLEIPRPARLQAPESGVAGVGSGSVFAWEGEAAAYLLFIEDVETRRRALRVLTSSKQITLPRLPYFSLTTGGEHYWRVETHGRGRNIDELAGPEGFADAFSSPAGGSGGPRRSEGSYSISVGRAFLAE